eukprot:scaffold47493_cov63-Phaeocystis_antarctica.AAC.1
MVGGVTVYRKKTVAKVDAFSPASKFVPAERDRSDATAMLNELILSALAFSPSAHHASIVLPTATVAWRARHATAVAETPTPSEPLPTALALGPLFLSQVIGEPYFVPVYLPLLVYCTVVAGRIGGPPAATALASSTLLYVGVSELAHIATPSTLLLEINAAACVLLVAASFLPPASSLQGGDEGLAEKGADNQPQPQPQSCARARVLPMGWCS